MANSKSASYTLSTLLKLNDQLSAQMNKPIGVLRTFEKETMKAYKAHTLLKQAMGGGTGASSVERAVRGMAKAQTDVTRGMQGQVKLQIQHARLGVVEARQTTAQARALVAMNQAEGSRLRTKQQGVRLSQQELSLQQQIAKASRPPRPRWSGGGGVTGGQLAGAVVGAGAAYAGGTYLARGYRDSTTLEDARVNLQSTITTTDRAGQFDRAARDRQMGDLTAQAMQLGNKLPGDTMQYLDMFSGLKQRGLQTEDVLGGAGRATAYLSVANKADPRQTAQDVAQYGGIYGLKGKEYERSTDLLSRINTSKGLEAGELIESSKYFQGRAGQPLGLKGLEGAESSARYLAFMRQATGMEGSAVGTSASTFLTQLIKKPKELAALSKATGVDLKPTDKAGKFIGLGPLTEKFAKLEGKLTNEQQVKFGNKIAGEEGSAVFSAMVNKGKEFKAFNESIDSTISMFAKVDALTGTTASKMESLAGTYSNLNAEMFSAYTKALDPLLDKTNIYLGQLQGVAAQHQNVASFTGGVIGIGTAALGATPHLSNLIRAITGAGGGGGGGTSGGGSPGVLGSGIEVPEAAAAAWAGGKVLKYGKGLLRGGAVPLAGAALAGIGYSIYNDSRTRREAEQSATERFTRINTERNLAGGVLPKDRAVTIAAEAAEREKLGGVNPSWVSGLRGPALGYLGPTRPTKYDPQRVGQYQRQFPEYKQPEIMRERINRVRGDVSSGVISPAIGEAKLAFFQKAFGDSFKTAQEQLTAEMLRTQDSSSDVNRVFQLVAEKSLGLPASFNLLDAALKSASVRISGTTFYVPPAPPKPYTTGTVDSVTNNSSGLPMPGIPSRASGGMVERGGMAFVHDREQIIPARVSERWREEMAQPSAATINYSPVINLSGDVSADTVRVLRAELDAQRRELEQMVNRKTSSRYINNTVKRRIQIERELE